MRKLQLEIPQFTKTTDYSFPHWTQEDRVVGQPTIHLHDKYNATYKRVAETMIKVGPSRFSELSLMGLFATNHRTIGDYLQFQFLQQGHTVPVVKNVAVIERSEDVCKKILSRELQTKNKAGELTLIQTLLRNLVRLPHSVGRPPNNIAQIQKFQLQFLNKINFIDVDYMCNWGRKQEFDCLAKLINMYATSNAVIHINAISSFPRTPEWATSPKDIEDILSRYVLSNLKGKISDLSMGSYVTCSRVRTEMTSVVFAVEQ